MVKKALLIGINKYTFDPKANLKGCINDVEKIHVLLHKKYDFELDDIEILLNEEATHDNIIEKLEEIVENSEEGDLLVFYNSSHGSQVRDRDGDESDFLDECIITADHSWTNPLTDDKIHDILLNLHPDATMYIIFDCCHSGTATRNFSEIEREDCIDYEEKVYVKSRYIKQPENLSETIDFKNRSHLKSIEVFEEEEDMSNFILISACKDYQLANEVMTLQGKVRGLFTNFFCEILMEDKENEQTLEQVIEKVAIKIKDLYGYDQTPQIQGIPYFKDIQFLYEEDCDEDYDDEDDDDEDDDEDENYHNDNDYDYEEDE